MTPTLAPAVAQEIMASKDFSAARVASPSKPSVSQYHQARFCINRYSENERYLEILRYLENKTKKDDLARYV